MSSILIKNKGPKALTLNESLGENKKFVFEGIFTQCGVENRNNRIYDPEEVLPHLAYLRDKIKSEGCILGELDHPEGRFEIYLKDASHKITDLWYDKDSKCVMGKLELLNTPNGKTIQAIVEAGCPLFVSSRAAGTVGPDKHVSIQQIFTYDIVAVPGFAEARLDQVNEAMRAQVMSFLNESKESQEKSKNLAQELGIEDEAVSVFEAKKDPEITAKKKTLSESELEALSKPINEDIKVKVSKEKAQELGLIGNSDEANAAPTDNQDASGEEEKKHTADEILGIVPKYEGQDKDFIKDIQPEFKSPESSTDANSASMSAAQPQQNNTQNNSMQESNKGKSAYINLMNETMNNETFLNAKTLLKNVAKSSLFKSLNDVSLQKLKDESIYYQLVAHLPAPMKYDYEAEDEVDINVRDKFYFITINAEDINGKIKVEIEVERRMDDYFSDYGEKSFAISNDIAIKDAVNVVIKRLCSISTDTENFKPLIKKAIKGVFITESKGKTAYINLIKESCVKEEEDNNKTKQKYEEEIDLNEEGDDTPNPIADGKKGSDTDKVVASSHKKEEKEEKGGNDDKVDQKATSKNDKAEEQSEIKESVVTEKQDKNLQRLENKKKEIKESTDRILGFYEHLIDGQDKIESIKETIVRQWPFSISLSEANFNKFATLSPEDKNKCADFIWKNQIFDIQQINETFMRPLSNKINEMKNYLRLASESDVKLYMNASPELKEAIDQQASFFVLESKEDVDEFWRRSGLREALNKQVQNESFVENYNKVMAENEDNGPVTDFAKRYGYDISFIEQVGRMM